MSTLLIGMATIGTLIVIGAVDCVVGIWIEDRRRRKLRPEDCIGCEYHPSMCWQVHCPRVKG